MAYILGRVWRLRHSWSIRWIHFIFHSILLLPQSWFPCMVHASIYSWSYHCLWHLHSSIIWAIWRSNQQPWKISCRTIAQSWGRSKIIRWWQETILNSVITQSEWLKLSLKIKIKLHASAVKIKHENWEKQDNFA